MEHLGKLTGSPEGRADGVRARKSDVEPNIAGEVARRGARSEVKMNTMRRLHDWFAPPVKTDAHGASADVSSFAPPPRAQENRSAETPDADAAPDWEILDARTTGVSRAEPVRASHRLLHNIPFVAMLVMALAGVILKLSVLYWIVVTPIFGLISFVAGWSHFRTPGERAGLAWRVAAVWGALLVCLASFYGGGLQGALNLEMSSSPAVMSLLALGTFVGGVQARTWQICGVGAGLLVAGPAVEWLGRSPLLAVAGAGALVAVAAAIWWIRRDRNFGAHSGA